MAMTRRKRRRKPQPAAWRPYIGQQVADWHAERGLVPTVVVDIEATTINVVRIHAALATSPLTPLCMPPGTGDEQRTATLDDLCSWLPCRGCAHVALHKLRRGRLQWSGRGWLP